MLKADHCSCLHFSGRRVSPPLNLGKPWRKLETLYQRLVCANLNSKYQVMNQNLSPPSVVLYYNQMSSLFSD